MGLGIAGKSLCEGHSCNSAGRRFNIAITSPLARLTGALSCWGVYPGCDKASSPFPQTVSVCHPRTPRVCRWACAFFLTIRDSIPPGSQEIVAPAFFFWHSGLGLPAPLVDNRTEESRVGWQRQNEMLSPGIASQKRPPVQRGAFRPLYLILFIRVCSMESPYPANFLFRAQFDVDLSQLFSPAADRAKLFLCRLCHRL